MKAIKVSEAMAYLGLLFLGILILQLTRSMYIDAYGLDGGRIDLLGFALNSGIGMLLMMYGVQNRLVLYVPLILIMLFIVLLVLNVEFNTDESFKSVVLSRYGVLTWLLIGVWSALSIRAVRCALENGISKRLARLRTIAIYLFLLPTAWLTYCYTITRVSTLSYQVISSYAIILICVSVFSLHAFSKTSPTRGVVASLPIYLFLVLASLLVNAVALMQSTGIVAFWVASLPVIIASLVARSGLVLRLSIVAALLFLMYWLVSALFLDDLLQNTRFSSMSDGILTISSLQTRLELLPGFIPQFMVAPIFGDFNAEVKVGFYQGEYMHSLPLSLLTHTGALGFLIMLISWQMLYVSKIRSVTLMDLNNKLIFRLFMIITVLASIYAFFTWQPFWFFLGYMCVNAYQQQSREQSR